MKKIFRFLITAYQLWLWVKLFWLIRREKKEEKEQVHELDKMWNKTGCNGN